MQRGTINGHSDHDAIVLIWERLNWMVPIVRRLDRLSWIMLGALVVNSGLTIADLFRANATHAPAAVVIEYLWRLL